MTPQDRIVGIRGGTVRFRVLSGGRGPHLVYFHSFHDRDGWPPLLEALAERFTASAPFHPGVRGSEGVEALDDVVDLALAYDELLSGLEIESGYLAGHFFGAMGKFVWPIPDKGLRKRIHRLAAPTLLLWGDDDRVNPREYGAEFARLIPGAELRLVPAGHMLHLEAADAVLRTAATFFA